MRKINKENNPPSIKFVQSGHEHRGIQKWRVSTLKVCRDFDRDSADFLSGKYLFNSDFGYHVFRDCLRNSIGSKCCFCEKPIAEGEIEHFRPKSGFKAARKSPLIRPGYYWLAYNWDNLLLSCDECNDQKRKGNLFPLFTESNRATNRSIPVSREDPVLIDPSKEDPGVHISFNLEMPIALDNRGAQVIDIFDLANRGDLTNGRQEKLRLFKLSKKISQLSPGEFSQAEIDEEKNNVAHYQDPKSPFSGMISENIKRGIL